MIFNLDKEITHEYVNDIIGKILISTDKRLYLFINSPGGNLRAAKFLHGFLLSCNKEVVTCVTGFCASSALLINAASNERWVTPTGMFLIHEVRDTALPDPIIATLPEKDDDASILMKDYDDIVKACQAAKVDLQKHTDEYYKLIADHSGLTVNKIKKSVAGVPDGDWIITAKEALKLGLVENIGVPVIEQNAVE